MKPTRRDPDGVLTNQALGCHWAACPKATKAFNAWRIKTIGY